MLVLYYKSAVENQFKAISLSYQNTPLAMRELFSFDENATKKMLLSLKETFDLEEALLISTCNRTEIYYLSEIDINSQLIDYLVDNSELKNIKNIKSYFKNFTNHIEAVNYLFEVSIGIHSQVVGDLQIISQAKDAYQWSADVNMAGPFIHRLMHAIFYANKKIVQETSFRDGAASISYAATELVDEVISANKNAQILVVGTGEIGEDVVKNLINFGYTNFTLCNRTYENAVSLAGKLNINSSSILPYDLLFGHIKYFDVIISAVQVQSPIFTTEALKDCKILTHKYFIDLSVPRSVDPKIESIPGIAIYNIEDLNKKTSVAIERRNASIPDVKYIIFQSVNDFTSWVKETEVAPVIHKMKESLETIRLAEINRFTKQLSENELKLVNTITKNMMQKLMKLPVVQLKAACKRGDADSLVEILNDLFDLEKQKELK